MSSSSILYVGPFKLPDQNAAAQRVIGNAKALAQIGHQVFFVNYSQVDCPSWTKYFGFDCWELPNRSLFCRLTSISDIVDVSRKKKIDAIIAYNYPAIALLRLIAFCRRAGIKCYADATEWYVPTGSSLFRLFKSGDTELRMRYLHFKLDGIVTVSSYLSRYYSQYLPCIVVPPLVDLDDEKWASARSTKCSQVPTITRLVYCGSPSAQKECLDRIVAAIDKCAKTQKVCLDVVGISQDEYEAMYQTKCVSKSVFFWGRQPHADALRIVGRANWAIIVRPNNKVVEAGFPTKLTESITCGTPVIINNFSNVLDYLDSSNSIVTDENDLVPSILLATNKTLDIDVSLFSYKRYSGAFGKLFGVGGVESEGL